VVYRSVAVLAGRVPSPFPLRGDRRLNHRPEVVSGVLADECGEQLREY
jgi:tRNA(adenine34) deaminase